MNIHIMAIHKGKSVFYYGNCNPAINYASDVRDCNGENLGYTNDLEDDLTNRTIIWKHKNSKCNF
ncbi:hypothetical protein M2326_000384 [Flavobacterium sp. 7A]|nr:hypothetical protein [Flavobacterium sp. 7A]